MKVLRIGMGRSSNIAHQTWWDHPFSQINITTERAVGLEVEGGWRFMPSLASLTTMLITSFSFLFISFSSLLRVIFGYFWTYFGVHFSFFKNHLVFSNEILCRYFWYYTDGHYSKNSFSCHVLLCLGLFWYVIFYFLRTVQFCFS